MDCPERDLLSSTPMSAWIKDCSGHYSYVNPAFCRFVGQSEESLLGTTDKELWDEAAAFRLDSEEKRVISLRIPLLIQELVSLKGKMLWLEYQCSPVLDELGTVIAIAGIGADISLRKEVETQFRSAQDTPAESRHMASLGIMAAGITHELNQPLQAIKLTAESIVYWFEKKKTSIPMRS